MPSLATGVRTALFVGAVLLLPQTAGALSLAALVGGASLSSSDGAVTFSDFELRLPAAIVEEENALSSLDISLIDVVISEFDDIYAVEISGPLAVMPGDLGHLTLRYHAAAAPDYQIVGAGIEVKSEAIGPWSITEVNENIDGDTTASLITVERFDGTSIDSVELDLAAPARDLDVATEVWIEGGIEGPARISMISQSFRLESTASPVPEPSAALLFASGTLIGALRIRRKAAGPRIAISTEGQSA